MARSISRRPGESGKQRPRRSEASHPASEPAGGIHAQGTTCTVRCVCPKPARGMPHPASAACMPKIGRPAPGLNDAETDICRKCHRSVVPPRPPSPAAESEWPRRYGAEGRRRPGLRPTGPGGPEGLPDVGDSRPHSAPPRRSHGHRRRANHESRRHCSPPSPAGLLVSHRRR
jgi:hypothetical protein